MAVVVLGLVQEVVNRVKEVVRPVSHVVSVPVVSLVVELVNRLSVAVVNRVKNIVHGHVFVNL